MRRSGLHCLVVFTVSWSSLSRLCCLLEESCEASCEESCEFIFGEEPLRGILYLFEAWRFR